MNWVSINKAASSLEFTDELHFYPESGVKKFGNYFVLYPTTGTPYVSRNSSVFGMSKIDLAPAQTTATGVYPNSIKSADMSNVVSAPLCTPPIPPVTNTYIPAQWAHIIVAATVVLPFPFYAIIYAKSLLEHLLNDFLFAPISLIYCFVSPICITPLIIAIVAGTAP